MFLFVTSVLEVQTSVLWDMASQKPPAHYPITGVCIVADPQKCPPQYEVVC